MRKARCGVAAMVLVLVFGLALAESPGRLPDIAAVADLTGDDGNVVAEMADDFACEPGAVSRPSAPPTDDQVEVRPDQANYWCGYVTTFGNSKSNGGTQVYWSKWDNAASPYGRGWTKFNLSAIPDNAVVTGAVLWYYVYQIMDENPEAHITHLTIDPVTAPGPEIYDSIASSTECGYRATHVIGWNDVTLDADGLAAIQGGLGGDWCAFGWHSLQTVPRARGWYRGWSYDIRPYIVVTYFFAPTVTVDVPNGGESWEIGTVQSIQCTHGSGTAVTDSVLISRDGGSTWEFLFNAAAASSHNWTVTGPATTQARIRIVAINAYGTGTDDSDADFTIAQTENPDIAVDEIVRPRGELATMETFTPRITVSNYGDCDVTYDATFRVWDPSDALVYDSTLAGQFLGQGNTATLNFPDGRTNMNVGLWTTEAFVYVAGDTCPSNDTMTGSFTVSIPPPPGWHETQSHVPTLPTDKPVKQGGWLAFDGTSDADDPIYVHKGYKTTDFYAFYPDGDSWKTLTGMPYSTHPNEKWARKPPYKGSKGIQVGNVIYVTQGNNTLGFWSYHIMGDSWHAEQDVPEGPDRKKVKGGTDMTSAKVQHEDEYVYLVKGYRTEFYRFNTETRLWDPPLENIPMGGRAKMDKGSWTVAHSRPGHGEHEVYVFKSKYQELYRYYIEGDSFHRLADMPLEGWHSGKRKNKKSKDGGCAVYEDDCIFALKGGNTQQFWQYFTEGDSWHELDTLPNNGSTGKKKRVKYGADLVRYKDDRLFALKGNKTAEVWWYQMAPVDYHAGRPERSGVMAGKTKAQGLGVFISPNPLAAGFATLRYSLAKPGPAVVSVFDIAGRSVARQSVAANRTGAVNLDLRKLAAGVYLVRLDAGDCTATTKLVVQH